MWYFWQFDINKMFHCYLHTWLILRLGIKIWVKTISLRIWKALFYFLLISNTTFEKSDGIMIPSFCL